MLTNWVTLLPFLPFTFYFYLFIILQRLAYLGTNAFACAIPRVSNYGCRIQSCRHLALPSKPMEAERAGTLTSVHGWRKPSPGTPLLIRKRTRYPLLHQCRCWLATADLGNSTSPMVELGAGASDQAWMTCTEQNRRWQHGLPCSLYAPIGLGNPDWRAMEASW